jgi:hypothetical protein
MRIVVFSSLDPEEIAERGGLPNGVAFLQKPVLPADLIAAVFGELPAAPTVPVGQDPAAVVPSTPESLITPQS